MSIHSGISHTPDPEPSKNGITQINDGPIVVDLRGTKDEYQKIIRNAGYKRWMVNVYPGDPSVVAFGGPYVGDHGSLHGETKDVLREAGFTGALENLESSTPISGYFDGRLLRDEEVKGDFIIRIDAPVRANVPHNENYEGQLSYWLGAEGKILQEKIRNYIGAEDAVLTIRENLSQFSHMKIKYEATGNDNHELLKMLGSRHLTEPVTSFSLKEAREYLEERTEPKEDSKMPEVGRHFYSPRGTRYITSHHMRCECRERMADRDSFIGYLDHLVTNLKDTKRNLTANRREYRLLVMKDDKYDTSVETDQALYSGITALNELVKNINPNDWLRRQDEIATLVYDFLGKFEGRCDEQYRDSSLENHEFVRQAALFIRDGNSNEFASLPIGIGGTSPLKMIPLGYMPIAEKGPLEMTPEDFVYYDAAQRNSSACRHAMEIFERDFPRIESFELLTKLADYVRDQYGSKIQGPTLAFTAGEPIVSIQDHWHPARFIQQHHYSDHGSVVFSIGNPDHKERVVVDRISTGLSFAESFKEQEYFGAGSAENLAEIFDRLRTSRWKLFNLIADAGDDPTLKFQLPESKIISAPGIAPYKYQVRDVLNGDRLPYVKRYGMDAAQIVDWGKILGGMTAVLYTAQMPFRPSTQVVDEVQNADGEMKPRLLQASDANAFFNTIGAIGPDDYARYMAPALAAYIMDWVAVFKNVKLTKIQKEEVDTAIKRFKQSFREGFLSKFASIKTVWGSPKAASVITDIFNVSSKLDFNKYPTYQDELDLYKHLCFTAKIVDEHSDSSDIVDTILSTVDDLVELADKALIEIDDIKYDRDKADIIQAISLLLTRHAAEADRGEDRADSKYKVFVEDILKTLPYEQLSINQRLAFIQLLDVTTWVIRLSPTHSHDELKQLFDLILSNEAEADFHQAVNSDAKLQKLNLSEHQAGILFRTARLLRNNQDQLSLDYAVDQDPRMSFEKALRDVTRDLLHLSA